MFEEAKSLQTNKEDSASWSIPQDVVYQIMRFIPTTIIDDPQDRKEECEFCIQELKRLISEHQSDSKIIQYVLTRLSIVVSQYPYEDVYSVYDQLAQEILKDHPDMEYGVNPRISLYFSNKVLPDIQKIKIALLKGEGPPNDVFLQGEMTNEELFSLYKDLYKFGHGRITNLERTLMWYPEILRRITDVMRGIQQDEGPLPIDWRYFLAIISVSCYDCEYLYWLLVKGYLMSGGESGWLEGGNGKTELPEKLQNIIPLCLELAVTPWILKDGTKFSALMKGSDPWSKIELVEAILIMAFFHSLCVPVYALGILPEVDFPRNLQKEFLLKADDQAIDAIKGDPGVIDILKKMQIDEEKKKAESKTPENKKDGTKKREIKLEDILPEEFNGSFSSKAKLYTRFFGDKEIVFTSYPMKDGATLSDDYTWDNHGYYDTSEFFPELAEKITEANNFLMNFTLLSFGDTKNINTKPFRTAAYYYTEHIHGYTRSEYDYKEQNQLLHKDLKNYIKFSACFPQKLNFSIFNKIPIELKPHEICHISLLTYDAKFHIEVMYGLLGLQKT